MPPALGCESERPHAPDGVARGCARGVAHTSRPRVHSVDTTQSTLAGPELSLVLDDDVTDEVSVAVAVPVTDDDRLGLSESLEETVSEGDTESDCVCEGDEEPVVVLVGEGDSEFEGLMVNPTAVGIDED